MSGHGGGGHGGGGHGGGGHESHKSHGGGGGHGGGGLGVEVLDWDFWKEALGGDMTRKEKTATVFSILGLFLGAGVVGSVFAGLSGAEAVEKAMEMLPEEKKAGGGGKKSGGGGHH